MLYDLYYPLVFNAIDPSQCRSLNDIASVTSQALELCAIVSQSLNELQTLI
jgi:hypothetical protein